MFSSSYALDDHSQKSSGEMYIERLLHKEADVGNKEVQKNSEVAHIEESLVPMVEPNTTAGESCTGDEAQYI
jgi:hypothetical protein